MSRYLIPLLLLATLGGCSSKPVLVIEQCGYAEQNSLTGEEYRFSAPDFKQYRDQSGATQFYLHPSYADPLKHSSWRYTREFLNVRHKPVGSITGEQGSWTMWLLEDCRVLYTPEPQ